MTSCCDLQARRRRKEALAKALQATLERLQLYAHGARFGAWDEPTQQALQRHLMRGLGADAVDQLLLYQQAGRTLLCCIPPTQLLLMFTGALRMGTESSLDIWSPHGLLTGPVHLHHVNFQRICGRHETASPPMSSISVMLQCLMLCRMTLRRAPSRQQERHGITA